MKIVTVSQMKEIERETNRSGTSYEMMMENAGSGVAQAITDRLDPDGRSIVVLVGPGNNGGDGLVAGRLLAEAGARVTFYLLKPRTEGDSNFARVRQLNLPTITVDKDENGERLHEIVAAADVVVDALLGTGVDRPIGGALRSVLERTVAALGANRDSRAALTKRPTLPGQLGVVAPIFPLVVAVDCPTGLDCDSGLLDPATIPADVTVTFGAPKVGLYRFPGAAATGELVIADIGSPADLPVLVESRLELATAASVRALLPPRPLDAHKGTFGKVLIVAGSINYTGAAALAAEAAYRCGSGLVTLAIPGILHAPLAARLAEATFLLLPHEMGAITEDAVPILIDSLEDFDALLVGPGLGQDHRTRIFLQRLFGGRAPAKGRIGFVPSSVGATSGRPQVLPPVVVDADGLNLLADMESWPTLLPSKSVLTPHPGEMARLLKCSRDTVMEDRIAVAQAAAAEWDQIVVLKGAFTVVAAPDGMTSLIPFANPALATAGSGDVLAGVISAMLGMGLESYQAAVVGAFLHGAAGEMAAADIGARGVMAGDLAIFLAAVLDRMECCRGGVAPNRSARYGQLGAHSLRRYPRQRNSEWPC